MAKAPMKKPPELEYTPANCHARDVLARIGDKWSVAVIHALGAARTLRFNELRGQVDGINEFADQVNEVDNPERIAPRVEYTLTPLGATLRQLVRALVDWSGAHVMDVDASRTAYDARHGKARPTPAERALRRRTS